MLGLFNTYSNKIYTFHQVDRPLKSLNFLVPLLSLVFPCNLLSGLYYSFPHVIFCSFISLLSFDLFLCFPPRITYTLVVRSGDVFRSRFDFSRRITSNVTLYTSVVSPFIMLKLISAFRSLMIVAEVHYFTRGWIMVIVSSIVPSKFICWTISLKRNFSLSALWLVWGTVCREKTG